MANIFPRWSNWLPFKIIFCLLVLGGGVSAGVWYYLNPAYMRVGYQPAQPVPFSHKIHSGQLGMDCRYCHSYVETSAYSNVPTTQVCMNCHSQIKSDSPKLQLVRDSWESGKPVEWVQIHKTPEHAYFHHSVHVNRGVSCVSCHGKVNEMEVVYHAETHSMAWCLDCHRTPEDYLRPLSEVTNMDWVPPAGTTQQKIGAALVEKLHVNPPVKNCAGCHR
jgi:hypothetical protein